MLLVLDVGNTNVTVGLYDGPRLVRHWRVAAHRERTVDEYGLALYRLVCRSGLAAAGVRAAALSSVVPPLTPVLVEACRRFLGVDPLVVSTSLRRILPGLRYEDPAALGSDRLANAVAGWVKYGGGAGHPRTVAVVDLGTATKIEVVTPDGTYQGGVIAPGIGISLQALWSTASRLPRVEVAMPPRVLGRNNVGALQSGVVFGFAGLVNGLVERIAAETGQELYTVATGGLAPLVVGVARRVQLTDPYLTLDGIRCLWEWNA